MMKIPLMEAVIFDLDGVMIDSEPLYFKAWQEFLRPGNLTLEESDYHAILGLTPEACTRYVLARTGWQPPEAVGALTRRQWAFYEDLLYRELQPQPGLLPLLVELRQRGCRLGVASNSPTSYLRRAVEIIGVARDFEVLVGSDQVVQGKPAPDVYRTAAERLNVPPHACLALEDSPAGMQAALAAGMRCVAVTAAALHTPPLPAVFARCSSLEAVRLRLPELLTSEGFATCSGLSRK